MTDILQIKIEDRDGITWNINLADIAGVKYPDPGLSIERRYETILLRGDDRKLDVPEGAYQAACLALEAEYNSGQRKAANHMFIASVP